MKFIYSHLKRRDFLPFLVFVGLCCILVCLPTGFDQAGPKNSNHARGKVLEVDNSDIRQNLLVKTGTQELRAEILNGPFKGQIVTIYNSLQGKMEIDEVYAPGNRILVEYSTKGGSFHRAYARGKYRLGIELTLLSLFALLLIFVGGWTGAKALLSFFFAALMLWKVMVPLFLQGKDPIWVALFVVAALTASISFLVGGINRKGLVTFLGAFMGLLLTCVLALIFSEGFHVHGAVRPFAETLLYSGFYYLNLTKIFLAGIFVACSGAVMDLAMDIASSMHEVKEKHPAIGIKEHIGSGMAVGRAVIGTMTTTLLLAYSGSFIAMLMLFMGQGVPLINIFNLNFVAAEILNTLVGSFGLVTVAPFTAIIGGFVYSKQ